MARLVRDEVLPDHETQRELRFTGRGVDIEVGVEDAPDGVLLTVRVRPPGRHRLLVRRQDASTSVQTDERGVCAALQALTGPLSVVVLGPPLLQTEWLVV